MCLQNSRDLIIWGFFSPVLDSGRRQSRISTATPQNHQGPRTVPLSALSSLVFGCHPQGPRRLLELQLSCLNSRQQEGEKREGQSMYHPDEVPSFSSPPGRPCPHVHLYLIGQILVTQPYVGTRAAEKFSVFPLGTLLCH